MIEEKCSNCQYYHNLKHNFKVGQGFEESHCCDVIMYLPDSKAHIDNTKPWITETEPNSICEMFSPKVSDEESLVKRLQTQNKLLYESNKKLAKFKANFCLAYREIQNEIARRPGYSEIAAGLKYSLEIMEDNGVKT
jgi:hypothetical protein